MKIKDLITITGWALPRRPLRPINSTGGRDIYLGGSLGSRVTWREDIAIPMLLKHGLSYYNPAASACSGRLLPMEAALMEHSRVLLFVITDSTRGVSSMALVSTFVEKKFMISASSMLCPVDKYGLSIHNLCFE